MYGGSVTQSLGFSEVAICVPQESYCSLAARRRMTVRNMYAFFHAGAGGFIDILRQRGNEKNNPFSGRSRGTA